MCIYNNIAINIQKQFISKPGTIWMDPTKRLNREQLRLTKGKVAWRIVPRQRIRLTYEEEMG